MTIINWQPKTGLLLYIALLITANLIDVVNCSVQSNIDLVRRQSEVTDDNQRPPPSESWVNLYGSKSRLNDTNSVLILAPGTFHLKRHEYVTLVFNGLAAEIAGGLVTISVQRPGRTPLAKNVTLFEKKFDLAMPLMQTDDIQRTTLQAETQMLSLAIRIPLEADEYQDRLIPATIHVTGVSPSFEPFRFSQAIFVTQVNNLAIVCQTDRSFYRPTDKLYFRVYAVNSQYRPEMKAKGGLVWIESPRGQKIFKWTDLSFANGLFQLSVQLPQDIDFGTFKIVTVIGHHTEEVTFQVQNPKERFEVFVNDMQTAVFGNSRSAMFKVCAKYWDGRSVEGNAIVEPRHDQTYGHKYKGNLVGGCWNMTMDLIELKVEGGLGTAIAMNVTVTEEGTGALVVWTHAVAIHRTPLKLQFVDTANPRLKAGLPYKSVIAVYKADNSRAGNEVVRVCVRAKLDSDSKTNDDKDNTCKDFKSRPDGLVHFSIPPITSDVQILEIRASAPNYPVVVNNGVTVIETPFTYRVLGTWYSPSKSYLQIKSKYEPVSCSKSPQFDIFYNQKENATNSPKKMILHYLVKCQNKLQTFGSQEVEFEPSDRFQPHSTFIKKTLKRSKEQDDSSEPGDRQAHARLTIEGLANKYIYPSCRLLVFYHREESKEIVGDTMKFTLSKNCLRNSVELSVNHSGQKLAPRQNVSFNINAHGPGSTCAVSVVDEAALKTAKMFQKSLSSYLGRLDKKIADSFITEAPQARKKCIRLTRKGDVKGTKSSTTNSKPVPYGSKANRMFNIQYSYEGENIPFYDTSDAIREFHAIYMASNEHGLELKPCDNESDTTSHVFQSDNMTRGTMEWVDFEQPAADDTNVPFVPGSSSFEGYSKNVANGMSTGTDHFQSMFKDSWLFDLVKLNAKGNLSLSSPLPYSSAIWIAQVICVHPALGLGISTEVTINGKQSLFVTATMPQTMVRGEEVIATASIHSSMTSCSGVRVVFDSKFNGLFEVSPSAVLSTCVCPASRTDVPFKLKPKFAGRHMVEFTVITVKNATCTEYGSAHIDQQVDFEREINVRLPGIRQELVRNTYLCPDPSSGAKTTLAQKTWKLDLNDKMVKNTARGYITLTGDVFSRYCHDLERPLLQLPLDTEQGMLIKLNRAVLASRHNKLMNSSLFDANDMISSQSTLENVYREQSASQNFDGSFGQFKEKRSLQMVAAMSSLKKQGTDGPAKVLKSLLDNTLTTYAYSILSKAREFVDLDNEPIESALKYMIRDQNTLTGCMSAGNTNKDTLTSMISSRLHVSGKLNLDVVSLTANFLISLKSAPDLFETIPSRIIDSAFTCLKINYKIASNYETAIVGYAKAIYGDLESAIVMLRTLRSRASQNMGHDSQYWLTSGYQKPFDRYKSIETTSYYVLTAIIVDTEPRSKIRAAVRYLLRQQNSAGGFFTEKDTILGMQALSEFTKYELGQSLDTGVADLVQDVRVTANGRDVAKYSYDGSNRSKQSAARLVTFPNEFAIKSVGANCVFAQLKIFYNTLPETADGVGVELKVQASRLAAPRCRTVRLAIEVQALAATVLKVDVPYVLDVQLLTGFEINLASLDKLLRSMDEMRKFTVSPERVSIYFDRVSFKETLAIEMELFETNKMTKMNPAVIRFYDLNQFEVLVEMGYLAPSKCGSRVVTNDQDNIKAEFEETMNLSEGAMVEKESAFVESVDVYDGYGQWSESQKHLTFGD